ncbi:MAG: hypothetical protein V1839_03665 [archaeon]
MDAKIINREPVTFPKLAKIIQGIGKKEERSEIQNKIFNIAKANAKLKEDDAEKLILELKALEISGFSDDSIVQLTNILPQDLSELKAVLAGSKASISPDNFLKIHEIIKSHTKE